MKNYDNMTAEEYQVLYARFLGRDGEDLLERAGLQEGDTVIDLCSGPLTRVSLAALSMGADEVWAIDENIQMNQSPMANLEGANICVMQAIGFLACYSHVSADVIACQQGINYLLKPEVWTAKFSGRDGTTYNNQFLNFVKARMGVGGKFVFNTFYKCPPMTPTTITYHIQGLEYKELFYRDSKTDIIYHLQAVEGMEPHLTSFSWLSHPYLQIILNSVFDKVEVIPEGRTHIYICHKEAE